MPVFDEELTRRRQEAWRQAPSGTPPPPPAYRFAYRPELQFSRFDLNQDKMTLRRCAQPPAQGCPDPNGTGAELIDALNGGGVASGDAWVELAYSLLSAEFAPLPGFEAPRELVFALGADEVRASVDASGQLHFTNLAHLARLDWADWLSARLYLNHDEGNVLWQYAFGQPGLHVYAKLPAEEKEVAKTAQDKLSGEEKTLVAEAEAYRTLGGVRLKLEYVPEPGVELKTLVWKLPAGGTCWPDFKAGQGPEGTQGTVACPQAQNATKTLYWQPADWANETLAEASYQATVKDKDGTEKTLDEQKFRLLRRELAPNANTPMEGTDVAMLEQMLWQLGLSPQRGRDLMGKSMAGSEGNRINSVRRNGQHTQTCQSSSRTLIPADRRDVFYSGWTDCPAAHVSLEGMVRRFQGRNNTTQTETKEDATQREHAGLVDSVASGTVDEQTLGQLQEVWGDYWAAHDAFARMPTIHARTSQDGFTDWVDGAVGVLQAGDAANGVAATYTQAEHERVRTLSGAAQTVTPRQVVTAWVAHETKMFWGNGFPATAFRVSEGSGDEFGSMGFNQALYMSTYGNAPCPSYQNLNMFRPDDNLRGFALGGASSDGNCPRALHRAYNEVREGREGGRGVYTVRHQGGVLPVAYRHTGQTASTPLAASDDAYEVLGKAMKAYNGGANRGSLRTDTWAAHLRTTSCCVKSTKYAIDVKAEAGLPLRSYIWRVGTGATAYCFAYGEQEWLDGKEWLKVKTAAQGNAEKPPVGRVTCPR